MTTLGFGDISAESSQLWGHVLLGTQVLLGYILLGTLITRLSILFNSPGPALRLAGEARIRKWIRRLTPKKD
jgi:hypothetical protein